MHKSSCKVAQLLSLQCDVFVRSSIYMADDIKNLQTAFKQVAEVLNNFFSQWFMQACFKSLK